MKNILYIYHDGGGGVYYTSIDLINDLNKRYNYNIYTLKCGLKYFDFYKDQTLLHRYELNDAWSLFNGLDKQRLKIIDDILVVHNISLVHIRHFIGNDPSIISFINSKKIKLIISLHDMYSICPTIHLQDDNKKYCNGICTSSNGDCHLSNKWFDIKNRDIKIKHNYVYEHRKKFIKYLKQANTIITTSKVTKDFIEYKLKISNILVIQHGRNIERKSVYKPINDTNNINLLSFGALGSSKGLYLFRDFLNLIKKNKLVNHANHVNHVNHANHAIIKRLKFHFIGSGIGELEKFSNVNNVNSNIYGSYERDQLYNKIIDNNINPTVSLILSTVPETYSHTLTESFALGLPTIVSDIGALGERIRETQCGWVVDYKDSNKCFTQILNILSNPKNIHKKHNTIQKLTFRSVEEMTDDYVNLYEG